jgi:hypothetical protein
MRRAFLHIRDGKRWGSWKRAKIRGPGRFSAPAPFCVLGFRRAEADARTRTGDPFITSEVLYQLSYVGGPRILAAHPSSHGHGVAPAGTIAEATSRW